MTTSIVFIPQGYSRMSDWNTRRVAFLAVVIFMSVLRN